MNARAYFNDWLPATREGVNKTPPSIVETRAREHVPFVDGYRRGDPLLASEIVFDVAEEPNMDLALIADFVYAAMNRDDRPNGLRERSLSVGDLVKVDREWFECEMFGFREIDAPPLETITLAGKRVVMSL